MKAIEGINLKDITAIAETRMLESRVQAVTASIENKFVERAAVEVEIINAVKAAARAREKLEKIDTFIEAVRAGRWEVIGINSGEEMKTK